MRSFCGTTLASIGLVVCCALLASPQALLAQDADDSVPADLVRAILTRSGEGPAILPGGVSEAIAAAVQLPDDWRILGSVVYSSSSTVYVQAPGTSESVRELLEDQLLGGGWSTPAPMRRRGFVPAEATSPAVFCGPDGGLITLSTSDQTAGTLLTIGIRDVGGAAPCDGEQARGSAVSYQDLSERMPVLSIPEGQVRSTGMGGSGRNSAYSGMELETALAPAQIADLVSADLVASGWTLDASAVGDVSLVRAWIRQFEDGLLAHGQLVIITIREGKYDVAFQMTRLSER